MLDFLTAGLFKRLDDGSIHFFPFGRKRGYQLEPSSGLRTATRIKTWFIAALGGMIAAQLLFSDSWETIAVVGWGAVALVGYYLIIYLAVRGRPRSSVTLTREEGRIAILRAQLMALLVSFGLLGVAFIVAAVLLFRDLPMLWPVSVFFCCFGLFFIAWSIQSIRRKRRLVVGA